MNKYSSENFFFEDFNKVRIGKYGIKFSALYNYNGEDYNNVYTGAGSPVFGGTPGSGIIPLDGSNPGSPFASQVRDKIVEMAKKILADCNDGKAWYSQDYRTLEYDKPVTIKAGNGVGKTGYDCTSFVSCCYMYAGLKSMYAKSCKNGTLVREIQNGGKMIPCNSDNMQYILPGDILLTASGTVTQNDCNQLKFITTSHAAIYVGNNQIIHARGREKGIQATSIDSYLTKGNYFFVRPADLLEADRVAMEQNKLNGGGGVDETSGTINGQSYVAKIPQAVITAYQGDGQGANGPLVYNAHCASHNMPYGTKIYIPDLAGQAGNGIFTVQDTGGCFFDFDIYTTTWGGKKNMDAYVLEWGSGKVAASYTWAMDLYNSRGTWNSLKSAWNTYKNMNGKLVNFLKYNQEDANITSHPNYNS
jgi:3D (Asp-Asp-Asp) domain-containing protein